MTPDTVFYNWLKAAKTRKYEQMFRYEYFYFDNISYCFNSYHKDIKWRKASLKQKEEFIKLYQSALIQLLDKKNRDRYESLLRLKDTFQIRATQYSVNLIDNTAEILIEGEYPGAERIKLINYNNAWYLINPFGYQNLSYMPVLKTLLKQKKKQ